MIAPVTVPAAYARWIQSVVAIAIREARQDAAVRSGAPVPANHRALPDSFIDGAASGSVVIAVIPIPTDEQQLQDEEWPATSASAALRFAEPSRRPTLHTGTDR